MDIFDNIKNVNKMRLNFFRRALCVLLLSLGTGSCAFTPVYGLGEKTEVALSDIVISPPENNQVSYLFVVEMENRIGRNLDGSSTLKHGISLSEQAVESVANLIQMSGTVNYKLVSNQGKGILFSGSVNSFVSYSAVKSFTTFARQDATKRLLVILANLISTELTVKFYDIAYE